MTNVRMRDELEDIRKEYWRARSKFPNFTNLHEAYAVIKEEFDEFWEIVKLNQDKNPRRINLAREEVRQIAAMCLGVLYEFDFPTA